MLAVESDLTVVGEARNGQEVVDLSRRVPWEVAVLDYNMPGKNGLELIKELRQRYPGRAVLILSMYPEDRYAVRALKAGASGYLTKESAPEELVSAIRKVAGGGRYVTPTLGEKLALELEDNRGKPLHETLSDREYQVMWMIASGKTVRQIADELFLSPNTVSTHRTRILRKMNMKTQRGADALRDRASPRRLSRGHRCSVVEIATEARGVLLYPPALHRPYDPLIHRTRRTLWNPSSPVFTWCLIAGSC